MDVKDAVTLIKVEHSRACKKFPGFASLHEGYAVLLEEVDELWLAIKRGLPSEMIEGEAIQVAAMALRILTDCIGGN